MELVRRKIHGRINQWQLIVIISKATQNIPSKVWTDSFVSVNLPTHQRMNFPNWIKNILPSVKTRETAYFRSNEGSYYDDMPFVWGGNMSVPIR